MEERKWIKKKGRMVPEKEYKGREPGRRVPKNTVWNSTQNGTYVKKKHGPLTNFDKEVQQFIDKIESGEISDKKY